MEVGDAYVIPCCFTKDDSTATLFYKSEQVLRFRLQFQTKLLEVEKRLLIKSRQPWKIIKSDLLFLGANDGECLSRLFRQLDEIIKSDARIIRSI